ncbi:T9SS type A sorting domain-containing protein [Putridiphycobacter roseus]|nr:T9SS type A sorting domain-containing protein [Putridiphycobacter roseus]
MKKLYILGIALLTGLSINAQNILVINDNDNITQNTDTFLAALQGSDYSTYTYFNAIDSNQMPSSTYLQDFDVVIYYASTDGIGLNLWDNGQAGNTALKGFLTDGGRAWIIGTDLFYAGGYTNPETFLSTDFTYEYMGLTSYNVQSYGDDGNVGLPQVDLNSNVTANFPDSLIWTFSTVWWADGVTVRNEGTAIYNMGPSSYTLAGETAMTHYHDFATNVMGTYFDPALINTDQKRIDFINASLNYFIDFDLGINKNNTVENLIKVYPSPANSYITIESSFAKKQNYQILNIAGKEMLSGNLNTNINTISISALSSGIYFVKAGNTVKKIIIE